MSGSSTGTGELTEFFTRVLGGEWHLYSTHVLDGDRSATESQEAKLDLLAEVAGLRPGSRVLDVGCGWGGSLTYLARRHGVTGVGISLVPQQIEYATRRAEQHGADVRFQASHWADFVPDEPFDVIMTSGVVVHFPSLPDYFAWAMRWLRPGGRLVNEEMHLLSDDVSHDSVAKDSRSMSFLDDVRKKGREVGGRLVVDEEGTYVTLDAEQAMLREAGFEIEKVAPLSMTDYQKTVEEWVATCERDRADLIALTDHDTYRWYRIYFRLFRRLIDDKSMRLDIVVAKAPGELGQRTE